MSRLLIVLFFLTISIPFTYAQRTTIEGHVRSLLDKSPLEAVSVENHDGNETTLTDNEGFFRLRALSGIKRIKISSVGFETQVVELTEDDTAFEVFLKPKENELEEVVVNTGYQRIPKDRSAGAFEQIGQRDLQKVVGPNIINRLEGLSSIAFDKEPNRPSITVRGISTIHGNTAPLIILDDFPYEGNINNINPSDIESITILKDAQAASIWGARAGNGVIVLTTKKGKYDQRTKINASMNIQVADKPDLMKLNQIGTEDLIALETFLFEQGHYRSSEISVGRPKLSEVVELLIAERDGLIVDADARLDALSHLDIRRDYMDNMYGYGLNQQYALNIEGGGDWFRYALFGGHDENADNLLAGLRRTNIRSRNEFKVSKKLTMHADISYSDNYTTSGRSGYSPSGDLRLYDRLTSDDGSPQSHYRLRKGYVDTAGAGVLLDWLYYPLTDHKYDRRSGRTHHLLTNLGLRYELIKGLTVDVKYQHEKQRYQDEQFYGLQSFYTRDMINRFTAIDALTGQVDYRVPMGAIVDESNTTVVSRNGRLQMNYNGSWGKHAVYAIAGGELRDIMREGSINRIYGFDENVYTVSNVDFRSSYPDYITQRMTYIRNGQGRTLNNNRYVSQYLNAAYTYATRYSLSGSVRRDASNLFGVKTNDKWQPLWSIGANWKVSDEAFFPKFGLSEFKMRLSYGSNGNVDPSRSAVTTLFYTSAGALTNRQQAVISQFSNPLLRWEKTSMANIAVDAVSRNGSISGSVDYYRKWGNDLFGSAPVDYTAVPRQELVRNLANMAGEGVELSMRSRLVERRNFSWNNQLIFNWQKNRISDYYTQSEYAYQAVGNGRIILTPFEGFPMYGIFSYRWGGLDNAGNPQGVLNGEQSIDYNALREASRDDLVFNGPSVPRYFGALNNTFRWSDFELFLSLSYKFGHYFRRLSVDDIDLVSMTNLGQGSGDHSLRWRFTGDEAKTVVPSFIYPVDSRRTDFYTHSEVLVEKGDHIRFNNITLSYARNLRLAGKDMVLRCFLNATDLGIIWRANDKKLDPDYFSNRLPPTKKIALGIFVDFN